MVNEVLFVTQIICIGCCSIGVLRFGKEALITFIALQSVLANLFVLKTTTIFGLVVTTTDAFTIGIVLSVQLLQEYWGKESAQRAVLISLGSLLLYTVMSQIILLYIPSSTDGLHVHMHALLSTAPRITCASLVSYAISMQFDCTLYSYLKHMLPARFFTTRNIVCASTSQLLDTILFSFLGLYGIVKSLSTIILFSYLIKLACLVIYAPFITLVTHIISHKSNL
jgi:queuosine precursor transporter